MFIFDVGRHMISDDNFKFGNSVKKAAKKKYETGGFDTRDE